MIEPSFKNVRGMTFPAKTLFLVKMDRKWRNSKAQVRRATVSGN